MCRVIYHFCFLFSKRTSEPIKIYNLLNTFLTMNKDGPTHCFPILVVKTMNCASLQSSCIVVKKFVVKDLSELNIPILVQTRFLATTLATAYTACRRLH